MTQQTDEMRSIITIKQAVQTAKSYLQEIYAQDQQLRRLLLEEVRLSDDELHWFVTFGFDVPRTPTTKEMMEAAGSLGFPEQPYERKYKTIQVRASDGKFEAMSIREV